MAEFPALPLWTDAYLADCGHLTTIEHGAYLLLLMTMWRAGGTLPNDDKKLARYARLTPKQWQRIKPALIGFFTVDGEQLSQGRLTDELTFVRQHSTKQSNASKARWLKNKNSGYATAMPDACQTDAPTPTPIEKKEGSLTRACGSNETKAQEVRDEVIRNQPESDRNVSETIGCEPKANGSISPAAMGPKPKARRGSRLQEGWQPDEKNLAYARERGFDEAHIRDIAEDFRTYWTVGNGRNKTHADWSRAWQTWIRRESPRQNRLAKHDAGSDRLGHGSLAAAVRRNLV